MVETPPPAPAPAPLKVAMERPPSGSILVPYSGIQEEDGEAATRVGTMALTPEQAAALGIRPGYTPGALYYDGNTPGELPHLLTKNSPAAGQNER
jgi:hypothetical protein